MNSITRVRSRIDYQKTLRDVAKSMVRLRRPERLLKMITRFIDRQVDLTHTSLLVLDENKKRFTFVDSKGSRKFPVGLIKFDSDHPLMIWFEKYRQHPLSKDYLNLSDLKTWIRKNSRKQSYRSQKELFDRIVRTMDDLKIELAIPGYFKKTLLGMLLLGKKHNKDKFKAEEISFFQVLTQDCSMAVKTAEYHRSLIKQNQELARQLQEIENLRKNEREMYYEVMRSLAQEVHAKDTYTFGHVSQVERLGMMTALEMGLDLSEKKKDILSAGLILHDVGKIGIPDNILKKAGRLDDEEWKIMRTHVDKGAKILGHMKSFKEVAEVVYCHHENYDGSGYPRGIKGALIPIESRIISVVDAFHAIVSTRCYSKGRPIEVAFKELQRCAGTQFDPEVVEAFIRALSREMKKRGVGFFLDDEDVKAHEARSQQKKEVI